MLRGLLVGLYQGGKESATDICSFLLTAPNKMCNTFWACYENPYEMSVQAMQGICNFAEACIEATESALNFVKSLDSEKLKELYGDFSENVIQLVEQLDQLPPEEKGTMIGTL